ncbi:hypothetical protein M3Y99_01887600 [Aphelenchoides fujianensis]|nr:hypothetical protein M3Y99_01887600 [Aphelenchoides fujianensis]
MSAERACVSPSMNVPAGAGGSCPDLSEQQMQLWDDILFRAVQNERDALEHKAELLTKARRRTTHSAMPAEEAARARSNTPMRTSIYEICAPVDEETGGETTDLNGNHAPLSESAQSKGVELVPKEEEDHEEARSTASSLESPPENQTATQRLGREASPRAGGPPISAHAREAAGGRLLHQGNDQPALRRRLPARTSSSPPTSRPSTPTGGRSRPRRSPRAIRRRKKRRNDRDQFNPQFFAGMTVRVNPFEGDNEMELTEADCPPPSRFQMLQYAIQRQKAKYDEQLQTPQRVCCSLM